MIVVVVLPPPISSEERPGASEPVSLVFNEAAPKQVVKFHRIIEYLNNVTQYSTNSVVQWPFTSSNCLNLYFMYVKLQRMVPMYRMFCGEVQ